MGFEVWGLGCGVWSLECRVWTSGNRGQDCEFGVTGLSSGYDPVTRCDLVESGLVWFGEERVGEGE